MNKLYSILLYFRRTSTHVDIEESLEYVQSLNE